LFADRRAGRRQLRPAWRCAHALLIGCAQALAIVPGVSRSGATITARCCWATRAPTRPASASCWPRRSPPGAALVKVPKLFAAGAPSAVWVGMASAAVFGFLRSACCSATCAPRNYRPFAYYRFAVTLLVLAVYGLRGGLR
jgi:undecaprenyl-diphosphatase